MACKVDRNGDGTLKAMTFSCDAADCPAASTDAEIEPQGGLRAMGWRCTGGTHFCPEHNPDNEERSK